MPERNRTRCKALSMAKTKRKIYKTQRDKNAIAIAKELKRSGILSKQVNLHGGKYISRDVLKKVREYQDYARLNYGTVKVPKNIAEAAKQRGYKVVQGNRIVGPKTERFRRRLKSGKVTGVKPVKGGYMEEVTLPHTIYDMASLIEQGDIDTLKMPHEYFAFKYKGNESYRVFQNTELMLDYIRGYKSVAAAIDSDRPEDLQEEFENFTIFRLHSADIRNAIPSAKERRRRAAERRAERIRNGEYVVRKSKTSWTEKLDNMTDYRANKLREAKRKAAKKYRDSLSDRAKEELKRKARERAKQSYDRRKK